MRLLTTTTQVIKLYTDANADVEAWGSWIENNAGTLTPDNSGPLASLTTATNVTVVAAPASSKQRNVGELGCRNNHASTSVNVNWNYEDGTNTVVMMKANLLPGEALIYDECGGWTHYDANGGPYPAIGNAAVQADMEAATSLTLFASPGVIQYHPGVAKFWVEAGVAADVKASYNVTSLTDTGTGVMGITIAKDFSSTTYCLGVSVEATATTWAVANCREPHIRNATIAAGTVSVDCVDNTATTSVVKDPATWHVIGHGDQ